MDSPSASSVTSLPSFFPSFVSSSASNAPTAASKRNFWDFEAYSRHFLHERKLIEREKEEWKAQVKKRGALLQESFLQFESKIEALKRQSEIALNQHSALEKDLLPAVEAAQIEIAAAKKQVELLSRARDYFQRVAVVLECEAVQEEGFMLLLAGKNWRAALDALVQLVSVLEGLDSSNNLRKETLKILEARLQAFYSVISKQTITLVEGLGWPKIQSNEQTVEIIAQLQEFLTFGEALYLLSQRLTDFNLKHPLEHFIAPIRVRFNFHFSGEKPTNALDRPEWYLTHLMSVLRENAAFLREFIFPCWRLRDLDCFIEEGIWALAVQKSAERLESLTTDESQLRVHYLCELGKFFAALKEEFAFAKQKDEDFRELFYVNRSSFIQAELLRVQRLYCEAFDAKERSDEEVEKSWIPEASALSGDPSPVVLQFMALLHGSCLQPYSFIPDFTCRAELFKTCVAWLLERFLNKCQFECSPIHTTPRQILQDCGMINSMLVLKRVLEGDFGESLEMIEFAASSECKQVLGYDPSALPGTIFAKSVTAFAEICGKLEAHVFNYVFDGFLIPAAKWSGSMCYYRTVEGVEELPMNESFRLAVSGLLERLQQIKPALNPSRYEFLFGKLLAEKLASFLYSAVVLKNFFHERGAGRFSQDVQFLKGKLDESLHHYFGKVEESSRLLMLKERDPTAPFDAVRLQRTLKEGRIEELKRFLELERYAHVTVDDLSQIFASRRN